jgi:hypothetical protein
MNPSLNSRCQECERIARAMRRAFRADSGHLRSRMERLAETSGRDVNQVRLDWVRSIATMPDEEMNTLLDSHYAEAAKLKPQREQHEHATGHSIRLQGLWVLYGDTD